MGRVTGMKLGTGDLGLRGHVEAGWVTGNMVTIIVVNPYDIGCPVFLNALLVFILLDNLSAFYR